ncbi:uncharacterized protein LOC117176216 [Belonocnema kinseyi]|uniref:uncharacterized protein LOC117176216 n=1 Tax=Belonocnema kinseyi TaxID=2817044 RepID=UPI00143CF1DE|nr:uncharacterized protein LOC117176216 [Belonocnema kinseyi]
MSQQLIWINLILESWQRLLVWTRSEFQRSFQLIVITYNEKFIARLSRANVFQGFYKLTRGVNSKYTIQYHDRDGMSIEGPSAHEDTENYIDSDDDDDDVDLD